MRKNTALFCGRKAGNKLLSGNSQKRKKIILSLLFPIALIFGAKTDSYGQNTGIGVWFVDIANRTITGVADPTGAVITSFPVPAGVVAPRGLGVAGSQLALLDSGGFIYQMNAFNGGPPLQPFAPIIPSPSPNAIGVGYALVAPAGAYELFVVANDPPSGKIYWISPGDGSILNQAALNFPNLGICDDGAAGLGSNATGNWTLPCGTDIDSTRIWYVDKISGFKTLLRTFGWKGWGIGAGISYLAPSNQFTIVRLYVSDLNAPLIHVLQAQDGFELYQIPIPAVGANVRGVGASDNIRLRRIPTLSNLAMIVLALLLAGTAVWLFRKKRLVTG